MDDLTREFLIESQEGLDRMERCLTDLEANPQETALLADIFRSVHTIKGTTGFLGFTRLEKIAHSGENLLGMLRDGKIQVTGDIITGLLQLLDGLRAILATIEANGQEGEEVNLEQDNLLIERMNELQQIKNPPAAENKSAPRPSAVLQTGPDIVVESSITTTSAANPSSSTALEREQVLESKGDSRPPITNAPEVGSQNIASSPRAVSSTADSTLRVDVDLLNRMMNLVGELVLTRNQILQATSADTSLAVLSRRLDMVTADLRENVMQVRMQPVSNVFSKFPRIIRDLSQQLGRRVHLEMEGQDTELDKSLLEAIKDPLTHAVRNSLDHGIEPPDVREAAGKNPEGTLKLRAAQEGSHVVIEVIDDGAGISVEKVLSKAIERGLITEQRAGQLSERELLQLIFLPGFSTAAAITKVSGRGVGMDVVKTNVEKIGGKVEIDSRTGKGTSLKLRIPLTLAIIPALIVRSGSQSFALPQGALSELVHLNAEESATAIHWMEGAPLYKLRGRLLPLVFMDRMLSGAIHQERVALASRDNFIAVLNVDGRRFGLIVDSLADPEEIVVKPLSAALKHIGIYSGATVLGNGDLALILDPGAIAVREHISGSSEEAEVQTPDSEMEHEAQSPDYLLVETNNRQSAVLLDNVLRIERIPISRIEYIGHQPVLNFAGSLLPVEDNEGLLQRIASNVTNELDPQLTVIVCMENNRHVGIAVEHVLDVAAGNTLTEAGTEIQPVGVTLLKDRVTTVVKLGNVASLAANSHSNSYQECLIEESLS